MKRILIICLLILGLTITYGFAQMGGGMMGDQKHEGMMEQKGHMMEHKDMMNHENMMGHMSGMMKSMSNEKMHNMSGMMASGMANEKDINAMHERMDEMQKGMSDMMN